MIMKELYPQPAEDDPSKEPLSPQTAFLIIKTGQLFSENLLSHAKDQSSWQVLADINNDRRKRLSKKQPSHFVRYLEMQYTDTKGFLGDITEWDTKLFSFTAANGMESIPMLTISLPLEPVPEYALEVKYNIFCLGSEDSKGLTAKLPFEGQGLIEYHSNDGSDTFQQEYREKWRTMTQAEGLDLLTDLTILTYELQQAIEKGVEF